MKKAKVAILKTKPDTVVQDFERLLKMAEVGSYLPQNNTTIIKDNISWHLFYPGANTTPWQAEGVCKALKKMNYDLVVVENETVVNRPEKGAKKNYLLPIYKHLGIPVKYNFREEDMRWIVYDPKANMRVLDKVFKDGIRIPDFFIGKNVVHLPTIKTHIYTQITCSMKNAFGGLLDYKRHYTHSVIHETLVDLLAIQKEIHPGIFAVADGTTFGTGPGPRTMTPVPKGVIMASNDCVALDATASLLLGFDPMSIPFIRMADEDGLGVGKLEEIEFVGEDPRPLAIKSEVGDNAASAIGDLVWFGPLRRLEHLLFHTPIVNIFILASYIYHDYLWYPTKGKARVNHWMSSEWGRLFQSYKGGKFG